MEEAKKEEGTQGLPKGGYADEGRVIVGKGQVSSGGREVTVPREEDYATGENLTVLICLKAMIRGEEARGLVVAHGEEEARLNMTT